MGTRLVAILVLLLLLNELLIWIAAVGGVFWLVGERCLSLVSFLRAFGGQVFIEVFRGDARVLLRLEGLGHWQLPS